MTFHAILSWYDESPTWLAGCVASLTRIGVDHLIAVDGRFPHFMPGAPTCSRPEQVDAITSTALGANIALTLHRPLAPMLETTKRDLAFRLLNATGEYGDWALVIDADELVTAGTPGVANELAMLPESTHVVACRVTSAVDPYDRPGDDNDVNDKTLEMHQKIPIAAEFQSAQSRIWRVLHDMRVEQTHYGYTGADEDGQRWNLRPDIGAGVWTDLPPSPLARLDDALTITHRKNHRTMERRTLKKAYYTTRDRLGLEQPA
jgi:hypothetical protein